MTYLATLLFFVFFFFLMAIGLIFAKKVLKKGCSVDPTDPNASCACREKGIDPDDCPDK